MSNTIPNEEEQREENLDQRDIFSKFTAEQIQEKEQIYDQYIEQMLEKNKIPEDELTDLIESLKVVLENSADEEEDTQQTENDEDHQNEVEEDHQSENEEG
jgi:predicted transcriptional regulator